MPSSIPIIIPGFFELTPPELKGLWVGDEKYKNSDGKIQSQCGHVRFSNQGITTVEYARNQNCKARMIKLFLIVLITIEIEEKRSCLFMFSFLTFYKTVFCHHKVT